MKHIRELRTESVTDDRPPIQRVCPDPSEGLNGEQVLARLQNGYTNLPVDQPSKTVGQIIRNNVFTFFNLIFFVLAGFIIAVGAYRDLMFMPIVIANMGIGIFQELRAKKTIDKLSVLSAPQATVIRDGQEFIISTEKLVLDDVVVFTSGNQICADAVVLEGELQVNEALITGEAKAITKRPGEELLSGSFVVAGKARARLDKVGADSYASRLTLEAKKSGKVRQSEMMNSLTRLIQVIGILIIPIGIILYFKQTVQLGLSVERATVSTVAALVGMIPEGLYLLTSVALAVSVIRLAQRKTLVHELSCIETLARVDVLCVDKTGTITEADMDVDGVIPLAPEEYGDEKIAEILCAFYQNQEADNSTGKAMKARFTGTTYWKAVKSVPFTSATKWSAVDFGAQGAYLVGAPELILKADYEPLREQVEQLSSQGNRVLLLAQYDGELREELPGVVIPSALVLIRNKIRRNAPATFRFFAEQGVTIKVISGDNPVTVSEVAKRANIEGAEKYVDASGLTTQEALEQAAAEYTVFGRVTPGQKRKLVKALKKAGHTVAMTGDGVNDVLALKDADCSIAMASGSEAACHVSNLVLLNSDFAAMPEVVMEGRRVINNIERAASLFLVKNIFSFILAFFSVLIALPYPVTPMQLSLVSTLTIGIPAFFLALEPNKSRVQGHFIRNVLSRALPGALTDVFVVSGVLLFAHAFQLTTNELSTISAILLAFVGLLVLFQVCKPFDWKRWLIWGCTAVALLFCSTVIGSFFMLSPLSLGPFLVLAVFMLLAQPTMDFITRAISWLRALFERLFFRDTNA